MKAESHNLQNCAWINAELTEKIGGSIATYKDIENLAYDESNNKLMLKVEGADTPIPFSRGDMDLLAQGVIGNGGSINISVLKECHAKIIIVLINSYAYQSYNIAGSAVVSKNTDYTLGWAIRTASNNSNMIIWDVSLQSGTLTITTTGVQGTAATFYSIIIV